MVTVFPLVLATTRVLPEDDRYGFSRSISMQSLLSLISTVIAHFENCVSDMHRAIWAYRLLKNHAARDPLSIYLADERPSFISDKTASPIRKIRDAVHHLEVKVVKGEVSEGQPIALKPDGTEIPHPTEPGQTVKTIDRLVIGPYELAFSDIASCLNEMSEVAAKIAQYDSRAADAEWRPKPGGRE